MRLRIVHKLWHETCHYGCIHDNDLANCHDDCGQKLDYQSNKNLYRRNNCTWHLHRFLAEIEPTCKGSFRALSRPRHALAILKGQTHVWTKCLANCSTKETLDMIKDKAKTKKTLTPGPHVAQYQLCIPSLVVGHILVRGIPITQERTKGSAKLFQQRESDLLCIPVARLNGSLVCRCWTLHAMISMPQLENSSQRKADGQIKVDLIQAEPEATAKRTSSQDNISNQTGPIQTKLGTERSSLTTVSEQCLFYQPSYQQSIR